MNDWINEACDQHQHLVQPLKLWKLQAPALSPARVAQLLQALLEGLGICPLQHGQLLCGYPCRPRRLQSQQLLGQPSQ